MNKISAQIVADSLSPQGHRMTSYILTYPRFIHSELMTHRMFSRNAASSRAIPFEKMAKMVEEDPFIPIAWQRDHKGMQGTHYITDKNETEEYWLYASRSALTTAKIMNKANNVSKQIVNRLLEPFMWYTVLVTATSFENFFELRCPKYMTPVSKTVGYCRSWKDLIDNHSNEVNLDILEKHKDDWIFKMQHSESGAEIHIQALAEAMWDARNESTPKQLKPGEWHIPFGDRITIEDFEYYLGNGGQDHSEICSNLGYDEEGSDELLIDDYKWSEKYKVWLTKSMINHTEKDFENFQTKVATARCARLSYMTFDGEIDYAKDIALHDTLLKSRHMSPFEHCSRAMSKKEYESFVKGQISYEYRGLGIHRPVVDEHGTGWCNNFRGFIQYRYLVE